jgi:predicted esterase
MITRTLPAEVHGRYLYRDRGPTRLLAGFHGYAENAEMHLAELDRVPGIDSWSVVAVQALHPFYTRSGQVVASWMTSLDREEAIADNVAWVDRVLDSLPAPDTLVYLGFSQGAAMASRAAALGRPAAGLILLGGDIPPEVKAGNNLQLPPTLLGRGSRDEWYTDQKFKDDLSFLEGRCRVTRCQFAGGHEWVDPFREAVGEFLRSLETR